MGALRHFLRDHRRLAVLLVALALAMKALMPAGLMLGQMPGTTVLTVMVCADSQGGSYSKRIVVPHSGKSADEAAPGKDCPYSALSMASLAGADTALLAAVLAFILALGFAAAPPLRVRRVLHLRPPLRGPPATA